MKWRTGVFLVKKGKEWMSWSEEGYIYYCKYIYIFKADSWSSDCLVGNERIRHEHA